MTKFKVGDLLYYESVTIRRKIKIVDVIPEKYGVIYIENRHVNVKDKVFKLSKKYIHEHYKISLKNILKKL